MADRIDLIELELNRLKRQVEKQTIVNRTAAAGPTRRTSSFLSDFIDKLKKVLRNGFVWSGDKVDVDHGGALGLTDPDHVETSLSLSDNVTNDASTTKHGFCPKAPNDTTKYLRGDATWAVIGLPVYSQDDEPDIPNNTIALWTDTDGGPKSYILVDFGGTQRKIEVT